MLYIFDKQERHVRRVLRKLSKQRLSFVLQPGNVWVIEYAVTDPKDKEAILTSFMRGWAEPIHEAIPSGVVPPDGRYQPNQPMFTHTDSIYRLTDSGWNVVNRSQLWVLSTLFSTTIFGLLGIIIALLAH